MAPHTRDPLLALTRALIGALFGLAILATGLIGFALAASIEVQGGKVSIGVAADADLGPAAQWGVIAGLLGVLALPVLVALFLRRLSRILNTVEAGDPFAPENTEHLARMAWLAVFAQLITLALGAAEDWIDRLTEINYYDTGTSVSGFLLALTCFVLARVFRTGAAMRDELEGTV